MLFGKFIDVRRIVFEPIGPPHQTQEFSREKTRGLLDPASTTQFA
jgi:hypothetical protein